MNGFILKEIRAPKPSLVVDVGGPSPVHIHLEEVERVTSDLNTKRRRVERSAPWAHSLSDDQAPNVETIMVDN